jgi:hypothetical protein
LAGEAQRAGAQFDPAPAALRDVQHDPVAVKRLVRQRNQDLEDRGGPRVLHEIDGTYQGITPRITSAGASNSVAHSNIWA